MEEINISDLLTYFKSKLVYFLIIVAAVTVFGLGYKTFFEKPVYNSSTSLILTGFTSNDSDSSINNNDLTINQKLLPTYQEITKSRKVLLEVIEDLKLDYEVEELAGNISVTGVTDTEIIKITVTDRDAVTAYKIVSKISDVFSKEVRDIYNVSNISTLDVPEVADNPSNMDSLKFVIICICVGIILASVVIFIFYYFDTTIKSVEQVESKIDVPVLGSIPDYNKKKKRGKK